jgi:hypothetical protein
MFTITQPMDLGQRLKINDLQLDLGNIQIMWEQIEKFHQN